MSKTLTDEQRQLLRRLRRSGCPVDCENQPRSLRILTAPGEIFWASNGLIIGLPTRIMSPCRAVVTGVHLILEELSPHPISMLHPCVEHSIPWNYRYCLDHAIAPQLCFNEPEISVLNRFAHGIGLLEPGQRGPGLLLASIGSPPPFTELQAELEGNLLVNTNDFEYIFPIMVIQHARGMHVGSGPCIWDSAKISSVDSDCFGDDYPI